jgi:hypothetical protein
LFPALLNTSDPDNKIVRAIMQHTKKKRGGETITKRRIGEKEKDE